MDSFVADHSTNAFAKVINRLLSSRQYGEQWGRHWLDIVRYADTAGDTADYPVGLAWRYRNYVIDAFNSDKPYDEFLREQIAGDILAEQGPREHYADRVIATGFLAISRRFGTGSTFIAGPFHSGDVIKLTQSPGKTPSQDSAPAPIVAQGHLKGDGLLFAVDADGNISDVQPCLVPRPPK